MREPNLREMSFGLYLQTYHSLFPTLKGQEIQVLPRDRCLEKIV
jgi:hypothetical protein